VTLCVPQVLRLVLSGAGEVLKADVSGFTSLVDLIPRLKSVLLRIKERGGQAPQVIYTDNQCCNGNVTATAKRWRSPGPWASWCVRRASQRRAAPRCAALPRTLPLSHALRRSPTSSMRAEHVSPLCVTRSPTGAAGCHALAQAPERGAR
jgi:hypothetical protein